MTDLRPDTTTDDAKPLCRLFRGGQDFAGKQRQFCAPGISAQSVGAPRIHMQIVRIRPGVRSKAAVLGGSNA